MIIIVSILNLLTPINLTFYYMCIMINKFKAFDKSQSSCFSCTFHTAANIFDNDSVATENSSDSEEEIWKNFKAM